MQWGIAKTLSASRLSRLTMAIPFVGWLILYNKEILEIVNINHDGALIAVTWRIHLFYNGMFFIGAGTLLYTIFCPEEISDYAGYPDFARTTKEFITPSRCRELGKMCGRENIEFHLGLPTNTEEKISRADFLHYSENVINDVLLSYYRSKNSSCRILALGSIALFVIGSILSFVPSVYTLSWLLKRRCLN